jgi:hypothetical protein
LRNIHSRGISNIWSHILRNIHHKVLCCFSLVVPPLWWIIVVISSFLELGGINVSFIGEIFFCQFSNLKNMVLIYIIKRIFMEEKWPKFLSDFWRIYFSILPDFYNKF